MNPPGDSLLGGPRWVVVCSCGEEIKATDEEYARQIHRNHVALATWGPGNEFHLLDPAEVRRG